MINLNGRVKKNIRPVADVLQKVCHKLARAHSNEPQNIHCGEGTMFISLPGGLQQGSHYDVDIDHPNAAYSMLAFVYLMGNGKFIFYMNDTEHTIQCDVGDIIICSATVEHAG